jgi:SAM-dependent methyltransferase
MMDRPLVFYDNFSSDYDRFVNWPGRLELELPFLEKQLKAANAHRVLDAACGTGMHAIALAKLGFEVAGADLSEKMIGKAEMNANAADASVRFKAVGFGELSAAFGRQSFDALLCLGNSLPHLLSADDLQEALVDFASCLNPGGLLIIQNRNFDVVMKNRHRWMEPQSAREGNSEWLFLRFYDFEPDGLINFNILTLKRQDHQTWQQSILSTPLRPILSSHMQAGLKEAGFQGITLFGDLAGSPFNAESSGNLVVVASSM